MTFPWTVTLAVLLSGSVAFAAAPHKKVSARKAPVKAALPKQPYSIKGFTLGMTLDEFRSLRLPGSESGYIQCSSADAKGGALGTEVSNATNLADGITCEYKTPDLTYPDLWKDAQVTIATAPMEHLRFNFILAPDGKYRLYEIYGSFYSGMNFSPLWEGFKAKFGDQTKLETEYKQNGFGAQFEDLVLTWSNGVSSIELEEYFVDAEHGALWCRHKALFALHQKLTAPKPGRDL